MMLLKEPLRDVEAPVASRSPCGVGFNFAVVLWLVRVSLMGIHSQVGRRVLPLYTPKHKWHGLSSRLTSEVKE